MLFQKKTDMEGLERPVNYRDCHAKTCSDGTPGTTVFDHCRYAGMLARALIDLLVPQVRGRLPVHADLCVALHDVGKVSPGFQGKYFKEHLRNYSPEWCARFEAGGTNTLHAEVGASCLKRYLHQLEDDHPLVLSVAAHHGSVPQRIGPLMDGSAWQRAREELILALEVEFQAKCNAVGMMQSDAALLAGLTCVADWLSSDEEFFAPSETSLDSTALAERVASVMKAAGFRCPNVVKGLTFEDIFGFAPRDEQRMFCDQVACPGVYVMEATMGAGKTEAALYAAYKMWETGQNRGIYFALPTRLTSDRIHERVERFVKEVFEEPEAVRLSHGQAWLKERPCGCEGCGNRVPPWFSPSKRGLLYPLAVGTIDQVLMAVMNVKHGFVRRFGLAGKVVILDEVHSYDLYTGTLLELLVRELRTLGCTVIILSATLTASRRARLLGIDTVWEAKYPCVSVLNDTCKHGRYVEPLASRRPMEVHIVWLQERFEAAIEDALIKARRGCNVLCIANTVKRAQEWYWRLLQLKTGDDAAIPIGLLHSRFPAFRRTEIESEWMSALGKESDARPHGSILIATQIVEQSVDIDADYMISELAPIDMLFQRMGRLWRHAREARPIEAPVLAISLAVPHPEAGAETPEAILDSFGRGTSYVYAPFVLERTFRRLRGCKTANLPGDIRTMLEDVYEESSDGSDRVLDTFKADLEERSSKLRRMAFSSAAGMLSMPCRRDDDEDPPTRYGVQAQLRLLLVRSVDEGIGKGRAALELADGHVVTADDMRRDFAVTRQLYANIVSVPVAQCQSLIGRKTEYRWLAQHFRTSEMPYVTVVGDDGGLLVEGEPTGLVYRPDLGLCQRRKNQDCSPTDVGTCVDSSLDFIEGTDW